ncbi:MAG TPA: hypothetical protein VL463_21370 [Kofleriaceae bacterium]|nr:hypothetical protein [Kofleriaceae bacterium]
MRKLAFGALLAGLLVACGSKSNSHPDVQINPNIDAGFDAPMAQVCNPVAQSGCDAGEKCSWVRIQATATTQIGQLGCVPDGSVAVNGSCTWGAAGAATGYDNCVKGNICLASSRTDKATGVCLGICDTTAAAGAAGACATNYACGRYVNFFQNAGDPATTTGLCDPTCDPLTQKRDFDAGSASGDHCGGPLDANQKPTKTCIGFPSSDANPSDFTCGNVLDATKTAGTYAYDTTLGGVFANSCAAGSIPLLYDNTASAQAQDEMKILCVAYCKPADTSTAATTQAGGISPNTCAAAGTGGSHQCLYWWGLEYDSSGNPTPKNKWSDTLGYCFDYTNYTYDGTSLHPPRTATEPHPDCTKLSNTAKTFDDPTMGGQQTDPDNVFWGCGPDPNPFTKTGKGAHAPQVFRPLVSADQMMKSAD